MLDGHQHFWSIERGDYGWMTPDLVALYRDFGPDDLAPAMQAAGITRTILVQAAETEAETDYLLAIAERTAFVAGVVGWTDMLSPDFPARLAHYRAQPKWVGLRPMLQEHAPALILDPRFGAALAEVARRDVPFDILTRPPHLTALLQALAAVPDLRGILDHISKPDMTVAEPGRWAEDVAALAAHPRLMCKISGLVSEAGPDWSTDRIRPFVRHVAASFGPDRLVFGTDWPVCISVASHRQVVDLARGLLGEIFDATDLARIFETNACRFYGLD